MKEFFGIRGLRGLIQSIWPELDKKLDIKSVVNNLMTPSSQAPLSAMQGKVLNEKIYQMDSNSDGTVNNSDMLGGHPPEYYAKDGDAEYLVNSLLAQPDGICPLDHSGHVGAEFLPSYVDDVVEGYIDLESNIMHDENKVNRIEPEKGKIYIDIDSGYSYRWTGTKFFEITSPDMVPITEEDVVSLWREVGNETHNKIMDLTLIRSSGVITATCISDNPNAEIMVQLIASNDTVLFSVTSPIGAMDGGEITITAETTSAQLNNTRKVAAVIFEGDPSSGRLSKITTGKIASIATGS